MSCYPVEWCTVRSRLDKFFNKMENINEVRFSSKVVGDIVDGIYITRRIPSKHFFRKGLGYPISVTILKLLAANKVNKIRIIEKGQKVKTYETELINYINAREFNEEGFERQRCFPLKEMKEII